MNPLAANSLWLAGCLPSWGGFHRAARNVAKTQESLLGGILYNNAETQFGRANGFSSIRSAHEFQRRVRLQGYEAYLNYIDRMSRGEHNVLSCEPTLLFEPTSGSSGAQKLIPYNRNLQRQFQAGISAWIADLYLNNPNLLDGLSYWSLSPALQGERKTTAGIPIGFDEDTSYLGGWQRRIVQSLMAVPSAVRTISDIEMFRYVTLLFLLRARNLKLISVWNPSFLTLLVSNLPEWGDQLCHDLQHGVISPAGDIPSSLRSRLKPDPIRAGQLRSALRSGSPAAIHTRIWPALSLISCWKDANAAAPSQELAALFPQARLQGKGLLATEGFVSFPLSGREGSALSLRSHFFEFLPAESSGVCDSLHPRLAHQIELGMKYSVVITTGGGLYRYQLQDMVEVVGTIRDCPLIRFVGRHACVSDWFGEKLNEAHVSCIFDDVFKHFPMAPLFSMLACDINLPSPGYVLYLDSPAPPHTLVRAASAIEVRLNENFHYNYARRLGQLAPLRVFRAKNAAATYLHKKSQNGRRAGGVKLLALDPESGWSQTLSGAFLSRLQDDNTIQAEVSASNLPECSYQS
jgi:GH3 auxin-responsive promoter